MASWYAHTTFYSFIPHCRERRSLAKCCLLWTCSWPTLSPSMWTWNDNHQNSSNIMDIWVEKERFSSSHGPEEACSFLLWTLCYCASFGVTPKTPRRGQRGLVAYLSLGTAFQPEHFAGRRQAASGKVQEAWDEPGSGGLITALNKLNCYPVVWWFSKGQIRICAPMNKKRKRSWLPLICSGMRRVCQRLFLSVTGRTASSVGTQSQPMQVNMEWLIFLIDLWLGNRLLPRCFLHSPHYHFLGAGFQESLETESVSTTALLQCPTWSYLACQDPWWLPTIHLVLPGLPAPLMPTHNTLSLPAA